jgi:exopolysaccharide biosynthesis polyprenyl glycosylphosphotransferase
MSSRAIGIAILSEKTSCPAAPAVTLQAQRLLLRVVLLVADVVALGVAFRLSYWVRFDLGITLSPEVIPDLSDYLKMVAILIPLYLLFFALYGLYQAQLLLGGVTEYARVFKACTAVTIIVIVATFLQPALIISRLWLSLAWVLSFLTVSSARFATRRAAYAARERGYLLVPAVVVGTNQEAMILAEDLTDWRSSGVRVAGFVKTGTRSVGGHLAGLPVLGHVGEIRRIIRDHGIEDVIVAITDLSQEERVELCEQVGGMKGAHLRLSSGLYELLTTNVTVTSRGNVPLISLSDLRLRPQQAFVKALLDFTLAGLGVLLLSPLLLLIAVIVKLDSPGPVLYRRRVLGVRNSQFDAFKFRTMHVNGEAILGSNAGLRAELRANHKLKQDPRVTRAGRLLRRYSLDELPQLFNVLFGQMSLVGPRMIAPEESEKYGQHRFNLLTVKPGITGFWQVNGRSDVSYEERVRLDMYYIRNYSVWLDMQILFVQTLPVVVRGRGAY